MICKFNATSQMKEAGGGAVFVPSNVEMLKDNFCVAKLLLALNEHMCSEEQAKECLIYQQFKEKIDVEKTSRNMNKAYLSRR